jgi:hypothetical protein
LVEVFLPNGVDQRARMLEFKMNSLATVRAAVCSRLALISAGLFVLLGSFAVTAPAQAGYYRCGYPAYRYYPPYRHYHRCYSCGGSRLIYERRYVEREYVERRYGYGGYGGYRRHYGYNPYYRRPCGYSPCGGYRPSGYGYGYGYGGVGRRWSVPYVDAEPYAERYEEPPPRPPAPVWDQGEY